MWPSVISTVYDKRIIKNGLFDDFALRIAIDMPQRHSVHFNLHFNEILRSELDFINLEQ